MKRLFTLSALTSCLLVAGGLGLASCNDELDFASQDAVLSDEFADDLTHGWNLFVWNADTLEMCSIPLNTKLPVVVKSKNSNLSYEQVLDSKGRPVLRPHFTCVTRRSETLQSDQLHLYVEGHPEMGEKVVNLFLHPNIENVTRADDKPKDIEASARKRAYQIFQYGVNYADNLGVLGSYPWFEFNEEQQKKYILVNTVNNVPSIYEEHILESLNQDLTQWDFGFSFGAAFPISAGFLTGKLNGSFNLDITESDASATRSQYLHGVRTEYAANVTVHWPDLIYKDENTGLPLYFAYLKPAFKDALNNPDSKQYKQYNYDPTKDKDEMGGIFRLLNDYGVVYPIQAALGGRYKFDVKREEQIEEHSFSWSIAASAKLTKSALSLGKLDTLKTDNVSSLKLMSLIKLQELRNNVSQGKGKEFSLNVSYSNNSLHTLNKIQQDMSYEYLGGKTGDDPSKWELDRQNPDQWVVVDFKRAANTLSMPMISIEEFFQDKTSERAKLVQKALKLRNFPIPGAKRSTRADDDEKTEYCSNLYYRYQDSLRGVLNTDDSRMVLADLVYVRTAKTKEWEPMQFAGHDGKVRTYYPVRANIFSPESGDVNYRLNTDGWAYAKWNDVWSFLPWSSGSPHNKYNHAWYYALDYEDQCEGVLEIQFLKQDEHPGWWRNPKGVRDDDGNTQDTDPNTWVALKLGNGMKTPYEDKIKAIGFYAYSGKKKGYVFGASPLWNDLPTNAEEDDAETKVFKELWQKEYDKGNHTSRRFANYGYDVFQGTTFQLVWSKEPLTPIRSYYKVVGVDDNVEAFKNVLPLHP